MTPAIRMAAALFGLVGLLVAGIATATPAAAADPEAWVGSPYGGNWASSDGCPASYPSAVCSEPQYHHIVYAGLAGLSTGQAWATDIGNVGVGTAVKLYAAAQLSTTTVTTKVLRVAPACADQVVSHGGYVVVVGFFVGTTEIGYAAYAHLNPTVSEGQTIGRWGSVLGTVGSYTNSTCWQGVHTHIELGNKSAYSCFNKDWHPGSPWGQLMHEHDFIGFVGGSRTSGPRMPCP